MTNVSTDPQRVIIDGCTAATYIAYALSDVATVYPITPVANMGDIAARWALEGRTNVFGRTMKVMEMESELGAAGATHGSLSAGVPSTTFTSSQGLMLMIPNMYKMSGELLPAVFHVGSRSLATHALSIFGDHQDVMATRATGFNFLVSNNVQEAADMALVAHLSALEGSLPIVHFFDGWRTGNEMSTIELPGYAQIAALTPMDAVERLRKRGMNPNAPNIRGTAQNPDVYFQNREAANSLYDAFPGIVEKNMDKVAALTGRKYGLFDYVGVPDATKVIIAMGSACETITETIEYLNRNGARTGLVKVRLFRPFSADKLLAAIPATAQTLYVLDRTKEPGSQGEPLLLDVCTAVQQSGRQLKVIGGRYGLSSKDFSPAMVAAVLAADKRFTVGINDDVTHLSLPVNPELLTRPDSQKRYQFYGMGSDGTVGATRQAAQILSDLTGQTVQAFFEYSAKKSGGYTVSSLRMDSGKILSEYAITGADYVGINKERYVYLFDIAQHLQKGSTLVVNTSRDSAGLSAIMPAELIQAIKDNNVKVYTVNAEAVAVKHNLGVRINTIMEAVFLKLCGMVDYKLSIEKLKEIVSSAYIHEGQAVVNNNLAAIDEALTSITEIELSTSHSPLPTAHHPLRHSATPLLNRFVTELAEPCLHRRGDTIPVSALPADGFCPLGESAFEKRAVALNIPIWTASKCVECTLCSLVCAHAAIRPVVMTADEAAKSGFETAPAKGFDGMRWRIQVYPQDCTGCGSCATICPGHALDMQPIAPNLEPEKKNLTFVKSLAPKPNPLPRFSLQGSQLETPLLEFSGACGGCGETPYVKLLTQLFGERLVIANATGCSSIWGADFPSMPYCTNADGHGPAWANSLFEDNAEYGLGIALGLQSRLESKDSSLPAKPSVWAIGGDGWAYDIGYAGLDHVISQNIDINILVMDTECYSNTGGQMSKATPLSAVAKYAPHGKRTVKKDLGRMAITYGHVYVGQISLAANPMQAIKVLQEAEAYPGPSLIIAYCPCINHGIRAGMSHAATEMREAVEAGYWPLWHYNPQDEKPFTLDSAAADGSLPDFLAGESRYADLERLDPEAAKTLRPEMQKRLNDTYKQLLL
ncbi:MAG: pyruvate:ferredoxin (flavodoxin) oxidoreductase [Bacteroides sp.]|nr:pyruvate:ferredoxin (flavodoxin) oxidoreductase [Bacteroides sp.]MCM1379252.1 pyruvate:ferredoxin (flavodoxin) oxidoreductase [Bacteroides sp.]MCM1445090.1 pyruvate:ferredoxin (flavodoxin) oxidoreductase [Prevotella sp.]